MLLGGVVHENVEAAQLVHRIFDGVRAKSFIADIPLDGECLPSFLLDMLYGFFRVLDLVAVYKGDVRSFLGETNADGAPDAAIPAADQRYLPRQLAGGL